MQKLLALFGAVSLTAATSSITIACSDALDTKIHIIELEKNQIELKTFSPQTIKIKNRSELNSLTLTSSDSNLVATLEGNKNDEIILNYQSQVEEVKNLILTVTAKNGFDEIINITISPEIDHLPEIAIDKTEINMQANSQAIINIQNWENLIGLECKFENIKDTSKITKKILNGKITIQTKTVDKDETFSLNITAKNAREVAIVKLTII